jgi:hypothetical protein
MPNQLLVVKESEVDPNHHSFPSAARTVSVAFAFSGGVGGGKAEKKRLVSRADAG